jgi:outer membrane protein assembly factor BamD (BamD/ComL family)/ferric-dicitrate binding protein FerR (iron transport regulator)
MSAAPSKAERACEEARAALLDPPPDQVDRDRIDAHREHCATCEADQARMAEIASAVERIARPGIDDVTRARIQARLETIFDGIAANHARRTSERATTGWVRWMPALAAAAAIGAFFIFWTGTEWPLHPEKAAEVAVIPPTRSVLRSYVVAGSAAESAVGDAHLGKSSSSLEVPAGGLIRASLGNRARITLVGPGRLDVLEAKNDNLRVELSSGLLLAQYDHARDASLTIVRGRVVVRVLGTILAVDARAARTSVAVRQGTVEVTKDHPSRVGANQAWNEDAGDLDDPSEEIARLLEEHERALLSPQPPAGILLLSGTPERTFASVGRTPIGPTPLRALVSVGQHQIFLTASGMATGVLSARIAEGESTAMGFVLSPEVIEKKHASRAKTQAAKIEPAGGMPEEKPSAEALYASAERALRAGDRPGAKSLLERLAGEFADHPLADAAMYELARLSNAEGDKQTARAHLRGVIDHHRDPTLLEPARYLLCRMTSDEGEVKASLECLESFRRDFPSSPHDEEALLLLGGFNASWGDCARAIRLFDEYLERYPAGSKADEVRSRRARCEP